jgi:hypothetical protein
MKRHDWASGSGDCGRAQITQICAHTGGTLTRQSAALEIRRIFRGTADTGQAEHNT